jgi:RNA ligase (TIGR02306 family)
VSDFAVRVVEITEPVEHHPDADRLSLIRIGGYLCISAKLEDGSHRYKQGDLVVYVPEAAIVPEWLLKPGFWDEDKGKGILAGSKGDRVKAIRLRGIFSQGILFPVESDGQGSHTLMGADGAYNFVKAGDDVAEILGITKYEPPIPATLAGEVTSIFGHTSKYDFESIQSIPELFSGEDEVIVTEKIHGTNCQIGFVPGLSHPELFGEGNIYVGSKGLSAQGLVMKNNEANDRNTYVKMLRALIEAGFADRIQAISSANGDQPVTVFGEIYGKGIQDLAYGADTPTLAIFDVKIGKSFVPHDAVIEIAGALGVDTVPVLYRGAYDLKVIEPFRDGKDTLSGTNVREGVVIKDANAGYHPLHGRKIGKWVSPDYLLRKGGTEHN